MTGSEPRVSERVVGVDVARALASLVMIQGHAYHAWVAAPHRESAAYRFTRLLGTLPLPAFLVLAGAAVALAVSGAARAGSDPGLLRRRLVHRGLEVTAIGYAVSLVSGVVDGATSLDTFLRADVLHVIGLSIALVAFAGVRGERADLAPLATAAAAIGLVTTLPSFALQPLGAIASGPTRYVLALFVDVPGVTQMPVFPLTGWFCLGVLVAILAERSRALRSGAFASIAGASPRFVSALAVVALAAATAGAIATDAAIAAGDAPFTRAHPAILLNLVDLGARGLLVLAAGAALSVALPPRARALAATLGRGSLVTYVVHVPFCYGRLGAPLAGRLDMAEATAALVPLYAVSIGAVFAAGYAKAAWAARDGRRWTNVDPAR